MMDNLDNSLQVFASEFEKDFTQPEGMFKTLGCSESSC